MPPAAGPTLVTQCAWGQHGDQAAETYVATLGATVICIGQCGDSVVSAERGMFGTPFGWPCGVSMSEIFQGERPSEEQASRAHHMAAENYAAFIGAVCPNGVAGPSVGASHTALHQTDVPKAQCMQ